MRLDICLVNWQIWGVTFGTKGVEAMMPLRALETLNQGFEGFRKLEFIVDSGAVASVIPQHLLGDFHITQGDAAKRGAHHLAADGARVPHLGEVTVNLITKEKFRSAMVLEVAARTKDVGLYVARSCAPAWPI